MKKSGLAAIIVGMAALFSSCYLMSAGPTGTVKLAFPAATAKAASGSATKVRVYLFGGASATKQSLYTFPQSGLDYTEAPYPGTVTLSDIPQGEWEAAVAIGKDGGNGAFLTASYGMSKAFSVQGGSDAAVSVTTTASPIVYSPSLQGTDLNSVMVEPTALISTTGTPDIFASTPSTLYMGSLGLSSLGKLGLATTTLSAVPGLPSGDTINSLSLGIASTSQAFFPGLFVDTTKGILPYTTSTGSGGFDTTFFPPLLDAAGNPVDVLDTVGNDTFGIAPSGYAYEFDAYVDPSGFGGDLLTPSTTPTYSASAWSSVDLSGGTGNDPVYKIASDLHTGQGFLYVATKSGAFSATYTLVDPLSNPTGSLSGVRYFSAPNGDAIRTLGVGPGTTSPTSAIIENLFIGTADGAFSATVTEHTTAAVPYATVGSFSPVPGTAGHDIVDISVSSYTGLVSQTPVELVAYLTKNGVIAHSQIPASTSSTYYPFYAGFPGTIHSLKWGFGTLFLAGSKGLAAIHFGPGGYGG